MEIPPEAAAQYTSPFDRLIGLRITSASSDRVTGEIALEEKHLQPHGIVHGGVYGSMIEVSCSIGASVWAAANQVGVGAMGLSNQTEFLHSVRSGTLTVTASRVQSGGTLQLWQADVTDDTGRLAAHGKVRLMNMRAK